MGRLEGQKQSEQGRRGPRQVLRGQGSLQDSVRTSDFLLAMGEATGDSEKRGLL